MSDEQPLSFSRDTRLDKHLQIAFSNFLGRFDYLFRRKSYPKTLGEEVKLRARVRDKAIRATWIYKKIFRTKIKDSIQQINTGK